jgi:signal transduction histidine kinase/DNA-binding response OmpR family regulator
MTGPPPVIVYGFLLVTVFLLGALTLRLATKARQQQRAIEQLTDALRRSHEYAEQQKTRLEQRSEVDSVKDEFISTVSHELRTPLTSIRGALGLLPALVGNIDPKAQNLLRIASSNTERLIRLINDILDLERMESGRAPLKLRRCSIQDLAREAVDTMVPMAEGNGLRIELVCRAPRESIYFDADPDRILQVLTNLLSNAIKFSPVGTAITVQIDSDLNSVLLKVVDRGRGIPPDKLEAVFGRFQQVEASDASKKGGTGLGLAISRSIIQQHAGAIWAQPNESGPGTTLWVQLSRSARATDAATQSLTESPAERGEGLILVCDDDPGIREVVAEQLRQHGYEILQASGGDEVLSLTAERTGKLSKDKDMKPIAAILLDLYMPGLSGWDTLHRLKANPATAAIPVVILSVIPPSDREALAGEAQGWVQKPFNENLLLAELKRVLRVRGGPGRVLLVEQNQDMAREIAAGFEKAGVPMDHACSLQQAVDRCLLGPPDLVILDLTLPDGDGFSLVDWVRRQPGIQAIPLVVYSSREISEGERARLRSGPTQFFDKAKVKPREIEELVLAMVNRIRSTAGATVA